MTLIKGIELLQKSTKKAMDKACDQYVSLKENVDKKEILTVKISGTHEQKRIFLDNSIAMDNKPKV